MEYTVSKGAPGKRQVSFSCPACQDRLKTPLDSAGQEVECPTCGHLLLIPGVAELQAQQAEQATNQQAADQLRQSQPAPTATGVVPTSPPRAPSPLGFNAPRPAAISSQPATPQTVAIPPYRGLLMAKSIFWILAMLLYIVAGVGLVAGLILIIVQQTQPAPASGDLPRPPVLLNLVVLVGSVFGTAFYGFLLHVVGELVGAIRDIAMNSFRR